MLSSCNMSNDQKKNDKNTKNDIQHTSRKTICFSCLLNHLIFMTKYVFKRDKLNFVFQHISKK